MDQPDLDRRRVLAALASLLPAIACATAPPPRDARPPLLREGSIPAAVIELGRLCLQALPGPPRREDLRHALGLDQLREVSNPNSAQDTEWIEGLNAAVHREIEAGEFIELAGWQLAPTECRLYALAALG